MTPLLCALGGYLAGSIPFAIIVSKLMSLPDPRTYGSKNIGATNVLRSGSRIAALLTLIGDLAKGWIAVMAARYFQLSHELVALVGVAAFLGHVFPVWLKFNGGKGIATSAGVMLRLYPLLAAAGLAFFVVVRITGSRFRIPEAGAVASIATWLFFALLTYLYADSFAVRMALMMAVFLTWRHQSNIRNLFD